MRGLSNRARRIRNRTLLILSASVYLLYVTSAARISDLEQIQTSGELHVLTLDGPTTYFEDGRGKNGFEYLLAKAFADSLGVELVMKSKPTLRSMLLSVGGPEGSFAAANITQTKNREDWIQFSDPYMEVTQHLVYRRGSSRPRSLNGLNGELMVIKGSSHSERLEYWTKDYPNLVWKESDSAEMSELLRMVHDREISYTVVDSLAYLVSRHIYPQVRRALDISDTQPIAWAFPKHGDGTLLKAANKFLQEYSDSGELAALKDELLAHTKDFSVADSQRLGELVKKRLPDYQALFEETARQFDIDWHLLAAVAYQESHWNPKARSPTGVRGLMMLTLGTAREMNIKNRLDPLQSLQGGAAYLAKLKGRLPKRIGEPDRTLMTLAAYNVGMGHLEDARILTERSGKNPDLWVDVREHLPLLSNKQYYSTLKYGFARGSEPVTYVDNIQYYTRYLQLNSLSLQRESENSDENITETSRKSDWEGSGPSSL
ncbi:MAG: membrane-bound lytic murein transglycosylase MltF [Porticoccaceae bacterium]